MSIPEAVQLVLQANNWLDLDPDQRAHKGVFLSFQYPVEIPGISVSNFMKENNDYFQQVSGGSRAIELGLQI